MRYRIVIVSVFAVLSAAGFLFPETALNATNKTDPQTARRQRTKRARTAGKDYSKFSHRSDKHKTLACDSCHKAPTQNWPAASGFPDVADFPAHEACTACHRPQFFKGARPVICSICHPKVSPRAEGRFTFEKPDLPSQFSAIFPHDKHQDVIATNRPDKTRATAHAIRNTAFEQARSDQDYNNCTICHVTETATVRPQGGFPDNFQPPQGTFKSSPVGHTSCFNCHWKNQEPTRQNCAGCHKLSQTDIPIIPAPLRRSLKFKHEREQHFAECTVCHINITRVNSLVDLRPDVPITSCSESSCHGARPDRTVVTIETESDQRTRDANFVCVKCHTSEVGKRATPASHPAALNQ